MDGIEFNKTFYVSRTKVTRDICFSVCQWLGMDLLILETDEIHKLFAELYFSNGRSLLEAEGSYWCFNQLKSDYHFQSQSWTQKDPIFDELVLQILHLSLKCVCESNTFSNWK